MYLRLLMITAPMLNLLLTLQSTHRSPCISCVYMKKYLSDIVASENHEQISRGQQPTTESNRGYIAMQTITADTTPPDSNVSTSS